MLLSSAVIQQWLVKNGLPPVEVLPAKMETLRENGLSSKGMGNGAH